MIPVWCKPMCMCSLTRNGFCFCPTLIKHVQWFNLLKTYSKFSDCPMTAHYFGMLSLLPERTRAWSSLTWLAKLRDVTLSSSSSRNTFSQQPQTMMTSSNGNIFDVTGPLWEESTGHQASGVELWCFFFYPRLNKRLSKQSRHWWFEIPSRSFWRHPRATPNVVQ